jgi:hypothetical protein
MGRRVPGVYVARLMVEVRVATSSKADARDVARAVKDGVYDLVDVDDRIIRVRATNMRKEKNDIRTKDVVGRIPETSAQGRFARP